MSDMSLLERDWFAQQERRARSTHSLGQAQNRYERQLANVQQGWRTDDTTRQYDRGRETLHNPWNQRGMMNSGMWQNQLGRFNADRLRDINRTHSMASMQNQGYDLASSQLDTVRDAALEDLRLQQQAYEETLAAVARRNR